MILENLRHLVYGIAKDETLAITRFSKWTIAGSKFCVQDKYLSRAVDKALVEIAKRETEK